MCITRIYTLAHIRLFVHQFYIVHFLYFFQCCGTVTIYYGSGSGSGSDY
jgi:hypothetical protein